MDVIASFTDMSKSLAIVAPDYFVVPVWYAVVCFTKYSGTVFEKGFIRGLATCDLYNREWTIGSVAVKPMHRY